MLKPAEATPAAMAKGVAAPNVAMVNATAITTKQTAFRILNLLISFYFNFNLTKLVSIFIIFFLLFFYI